MISIAPSGYHQFSALGQLDLRNKPTKLLGDGWWKSIRDVPGLMAEECKQIARRARGEGAIDDTA